MAIRGNHKPTGKNPMAKIKPKAMPNPHAASAGILRNAGLIRGNALAFAERIREKHPFELEGASVAARVDVYFRNSVKCQGIMAGYFFKLAFDASGMQPKDAKHFAEFSNHALGKIKPENYGNDSRFYASAQAFGADELESVRRMSAQAKAAVSDSLVKISSVLDAEIGDLANPTAHIVMHGITHAKALWGRALEQAGR